MLSTILNKYKQNTFSWEDAEKLMSISSLPEEEWELFFQEIAKYRWDHLKHSKKIKIFTPGLHFPAVSLTGGECALSCDHCDKKYLQNMRDASTPEKFQTQMQRIIDNDGIGALLSGGSDENGQVPVSQFSEEIRNLKTKHPEFYFNSHIGILDPPTADKIASSGVDMVSFDLILDNKAIKDMFHLSRTLEDYQKSYLVYEENNHLSID